MNRTLNAIYRFLVSVKLAVLVIVGLALGATAGTFIESIYDTRTAVYWVYGASWFQFILLLLGVNILAVMVDRFPWKRRHLPFLLAHIGIILTLVGAFLTKYRGIDGIMTVAEGEIANSVELPEHLFSVGDESGRFEATEIQWRPPGVKFRPIELPRHGLKVVDYITHADAQFDFTPAKADSVMKAPAVRLRLEGGPMNFKKEFWLWAGDAGWSSIEMGPATFGILAPGTDFTGTADEGTRLELRPTKDGKLEYRARSRSGKSSRGSIEPEKITKDGWVIQPGWMANTGTPLQVRVLRWIPDAVNSTQYVPARAQYGEQAPSPAIRVVTDDAQGPGVWLGLHDRRIVHSGGRELRLTFAPRQVMVPFGIRLERFQIDHYQGTSSPREFSSRVSVIDREFKAGAPRTISMNEPLDRDGYTFYQASYIPADPRPTVSVFSVNQDPGRFLKYLGSLLLVMGSIALFVTKTAKRGKVQTHSTRAAPAHSSDPVTTGPISSASEEV